MSDGASGPLAGVRILDLTSVLMGPYATQIFADLGADVIKIEGPQGDTTRHIPPGPVTGCGAMYMNLNRGKRSLVLDLKQDSAREALLKLAETSDVFIHSMRSEAIGRLGLPYSVLQAANSRIIYASLCGFGRNGSYRNYPAYDDIVQAASGVVDLQARLSEGRPTYVANVVADKVTGLTGAYAVIAALFAREKSGIGQEIEIPMFETMVSFNCVEHLCGSLFDPPIGKPEYGRATSEHRRPYETADGFIAVLIYNDKQWQALFREIGDPEWSKDPMFRNLESRTRNIGSVLARVADLMLTRPTAAWLEALRKAEIPAAEIASLSQLLHDGHLEESGFWQERSSEWGDVRFPGIPTYFSETPGEIRSAGPVLGADSGQILEEAGLSTSEIGKMASSGATRL